MPYHLLPRVQKIKDNFFPIGSSILQPFPPGSSPDIQNGVRQRRAPNQNLLPSSIDTALPRLSNASSKPAVTAAGTPRWLLAVLLLLAVMVVVWMLGVVYGIYVHFLRPSPSSRASGRHSKKRSDLESLAFELERPNDKNRRGRGARRSALSLPTTNRSFSLAGLSKTRKAPPPGLDLEALRGWDGKRGNWWSRLPSIVQRRVSSYSSGREAPRGYDGFAKSDVDLARQRGSGSGDESGDHIDINAGARLLHDLGIGMSSAVATGGWRSGSGSLVARSAGGRSEAWSE
ncbi:MAG: hypothetical protein Q9200_003938 [Gallowayella weberi]